MPDEQNDHTESDNTPPDDSPPPEQPPMPEPPPPAHVTDPIPPPAYDWSEEGLDAWFDEEYGSDEAWKKHLRGLERDRSVGVGGAEEGGSDPDPSLQALFDAVFNPEGYGPLDVVTDWSRLSVEFKKNFREFTESQQQIDSMESVIPDMPHLFPGHESESESASASALPFGWSSQWFWGVIVAVILGVVVGGFLLFGGGPDAGEVAVDTPSQAVDAAPAPAADVPAADVPAADVPAADAGSSLESSSSGSSDGPASPAATPTDSQPDACEVAAGQVSTLSFKSPDVGPAISKLFWFSSAYDLGFPTPAFEWEGVPEATTLLLITVQEINDAEADGRWHRQRHLRPRCRRMAHPRSMEGDNSEQPHGARQDLVHWWRRAGRYESGQPW